jgi:6-phosphofructokinase
MRGEKFERIRNLIKGVSPVHNSNSDNIIGIAVHGKPCCGMNAILNCLVNIGISKNFKIIYFFNGYRGIQEKNYKEGHLYEFSNKHDFGGISIGNSNEEDIVNLDFNLIKKNLKELKIENLILIGNSQNLKIFSQLAKGDDENKAQGCIKNLLLIPACIENDMPSQQSIGSDTALNMILKGIEPLRICNNEKRIIMMEIEGGMCGYLTIMSGIACGVFEVIYPEDCHLNDLILIKRRIKELFKSNTKGCVIFRNKNTFNGITTEDLCKILSYNFLEGNDESPEQGLEQEKRINQDDERIKTGILSAKTRVSCIENTNLNPSLSLKAKFRNIPYEFSILGNFQNGITPTAIDKINGRLSAFKAVEMCCSTNNSTNCGVIGVYNLEGKFTDLSVEKKGDFLKYSKICSLLDLNE